MSGAVLNSAALNSDASRTPRRRGPRRSSQRALSAALAVSLPLCASGWSRYLSAVPNSLALPGTLAVGHVDPWGHGPVNAFGADFARWGHNWTTALCHADSDGDGYSNGVELGDPCCKFRPGKVRPSRLTDVSHPGVATSVPSHNYSCPDGPGGGGSDDSGDEWPGEGDAGADAAAAADVGGGGAEDEDEGGAEDESGAEVGDDAASAGDDGDAGGAVNGTNAAAAAGGEGEGEGGAARDSGGRRLRGGAVAL